MRECLADSSTDGICEWDSRNEVKMLTYSGGLKWRKLKFIYPWYKKTLMWGRKIFVDSGSTI